MQKQKKIKNYFNKNIVLSEEDNKRFQSSNRCWICNKWLDVGDNKVRGHDHVTKNIEVLLIWIVILKLKSDYHLPKKMHYLLHWKPFKNDEESFLFHL